MKKISTFDNFGAQKLPATEFETDYTLDESEVVEMNAFEQACLEEGISIENSSSLNESIDAAIEDLDNIDEKLKLGKFLKNIGSKALGFVKNNLGKIAGTLGISLTGPLGPVVGILSKGLGGMLAKFKGEKIDAKALRQAASTDPEISKVSGIYTKTLQKLLDDAKKTPAAFMTGNSVESIKNLATISTAANQTVSQISKEAKTAVKPS